MANLRKLSEAITICGKFTSKEQFLQTAADYASFVYLCPEAEECTPGGSASYVETKKPWSHCALSAGSPDVSAGVKTAEAMSSFPAPTLVACASANRAGAMAAVHEAVSHGWDTNQMKSYANDLGLTFVKTPWLVDWASACVQAARGPWPRLLFRQLFDSESSTYTYILADPGTKEAIVVDPVDTQTERDVSMAEEMGLKLKLALNTHVHADHITGTGRMKQLVPGVRSVISEASGAKANVTVKDGERVCFGSRHVTARATPGHTAGCVTYVTDDQTMAFTGDALLIRGCGRTDFQGGSAEMLYQSVHNKIFSLPEETLVYPAHDYKGRTCSTVGEERRFNPRLTKSLDEFKDIMANLNLPYPKKIDAAVPANLACGVYSVDEPQDTSGVSRPQG